MHPTSARGAEAGELERELRETQSRLLDAQQGFQQQQNSMQTLDERNKSLQAELREAIHTTSVLAAGYKERSDQLILALERARQERVEEVSDGGAEEAPMLIMELETLRILADSPQASTAGSKSRSIGVAYVAILHPTEDAADLSCNR